jgi:hypothetical protein
MRSVINKLTSKIRLLSLLIYRIILCNPIQFRITTTSIIFLYNVNQLLVIIKVQNQGTVTIVSIEQFKTYL